MAVKSRGNVTFTYNSVALTNYCDQAELNAAIDRLEVTDFGSTAVETIAGDATWTITASGPADPAVDNVLGPDAVTPGTARTAAIAYDLGATTVTYTWTSNCELESYTLTGEVGGVTRWDASFSLSGAPNRAVA